MSAVFLTAGLCSLLASLLVTALAMKAGVIDQPNARSSHKTPTPRAGGLGIAAGLGAGLAAASVFPVGGAALAPVIAVILLFCALGLADDLVTVDERAKFPAFVTLSVALAFVAGPVDWIGLTADMAVPLPFWAGLAGSGLFVFVVVNAANFMDGSDGMLAAVLIPASLALAVAGLVAGALNASLIGAALAAALAGFIVFNRPPARVFAGDCGALAAGAAYAAGALTLAGQGFSGSLWLAPLFVLVFLADVLLTLLRRARHGRFSLSAHREHAYQRLIEAGWSHRRVAGVYGALTALICAGGLVAAQGPDAAIPALFAVSVTGLIVLYIAVDRIQRT
jgi:UDP-N-acetylmuramyl pentapeptide phosphotransferase/UDP-N-acetylglucosamine-1-phosphate transferase